MAEKSIPFSKEKILGIIKIYPTPLHIYDEKGIRDNAEKVKKAFEPFDYMEFFAVKANPNPFILKIMKNLGFGLDCSSMPELLLAEKVGVVGEKIMFSANDMPAEELIKAKELGAVINLDDFSHIAFLEKHAGLPNLICFRYNPGSARKGNSIIGDPKEAKYGLTRDQLIEGYKICKTKGVKRFGLHTMVVSNELNPDSFVDTAKMLFELAVEIKEKVGINLEFVNFGGGVGIPYKPEDKPVNINEVANRIKELYDKLIVPNGLSKLKIYTEYGRNMAGPYGFLISKVRHIKKTYKDYVGLDASMANLMRPGMYGAYHHITVIGKENEKPTHKYDVTGSLCENNDKFAIDRMLPEVEVGDIFFIHDTGAHGHAMGFNYNGKLRSAEVLVRENGDAILIRRAETVEDYFATLDFKKLDKFN